MTPIAASIGLLVLASAAVAKPYHGGLHHAHHHHHHSQPYTFPNGTIAAGPTGTGTAAGTGSSVNYSTQTVTSYISVVPVRHQRQHTTVNAISTSSANSTSSDCNGTVTQTYTNTNTVYVTASSGHASNFSTSTPASGSGFVPGLSTTLSTSSSSEAAPVATSATPSSFSSAYSAPASSSSKSSSSSSSSSFSAVYSYPTSSSSSLSAYTTSATSSSAYSQSTSSSSSSASTSATPTISSTGKRGCLYNVTADYCNPLSGDQVSWTSNWLQYVNGDTPSGMEYIPMVHSTDAVFTQDILTVCASANYVSGFNEPDQPTMYGGSGLSVSAAAAGWDIMSQIKGVNSGIKVTSPAVSSTDAPNWGLDWLIQFWNELTDNGANNGTLTFDIVNTHYYADCSDVGSAVSGFTAYVEKVYGSFPDLPVWVSEYGCSAGTGSQQDEIDFIAATAGWMDQQSFVEKYAYFMAYPGMLLDSESSLSPLGQTYTTCS